jgi:hypothetical protein
MGADLSQKAQSLEGDPFPLRGALSVSRILPFQPQVAVIPLGEEKEMEKYMGKAI